jgi:hypothetical protein
VRCGLKKWARTRVPGAIMMPSSHHDTILERSCLLTEMYGVNLQMNQFRYNEMPQLHEQ